jgi:bacterioferritin (cytochrome b1)
VKADPKVVSDLQLACGLLATIAEQYRLDGYLIRNLGLKDLGCKFYPHWHRAIESHLNGFIKQILNFGADPMYKIGSLAIAADIRALLTRECGTATDAFNSLCGLRTNSWNIRADSVPDQYEHAIQELQHQINKMERWLRIIAGIGPNDFVGALVEA